MVATVPLKSVVRDADVARMRGERWPTWVTAATASVVAIVMGAGVVSATAVERRVAEEERRALAAGAQVHELDAPPTTVPALAPESPGTAPPATVAPVEGDLRTTTTARARPPGATTTVPTTPKAATTVPTTVATKPPADTLDPWAGVDRHFQPGRTSWSTSGAGWSITVRIDNPAPAVGQPVRFDFDISSTVDPCCGVVAFFDSAPTYSARSDGPCQEARGPGAARFSTSVTFDRPNWQRFNVTANTGSCGIDPPRWFLSGDVEVKPRPLNVQGSAPPEVLVWPAAVPGHPGDRNWLQMNGDVADRDGGRIRSVTISWGDGSPMSRPSEPLPPACTVAVDGSTSSEAMRFSAVNHQYTTPGSYVVTVTAVSTACDGISMPQTSSQSFNWSTESGMGTPFG